MGDLNLSDDELEAIKSVDEDVLAKLIIQCLDEEQTEPLRDLRLESCGPFVASRYREFRKTVGEYALAKARKKRDETWQRAFHAGSNLESAVSQMKHRTQREEEERELFFVDDQIFQPTFFDEHLTVQVNYQWRERAEDDWTYGRITFSHDVDTKPGYSASQPKRKPSAAKQREEQQGRLWEAWNQLKHLSLVSVRDYLRGGGKPEGIPKTFKAKPDGYSGSLNNHSARFWP